MIVALLLASAALLTSKVLAPSPPIWESMYAGERLAGFVDAPWEFVGAPRPRIVADPAGEREQAIMFNMPPGGNRAEVVPAGANGKALQFREGDDLYFGWSTLFDERFKVTGSWQVIAQWKPSGTGPPAVGLQVGAWGQDRFMLTAAGYPGGGTPDHYDLGPVTRGEWTDWVFRIRFSGRPGESIVEAWRNGEKILSKTRWRPSFGGEPPGARGGTLRRGRVSYFKHGIYRCECIPSLTQMYTDSLRIGLSRRSVEP